MPTLRLGSTAPDFEAQTSKGPIKFHEWIGSSWVLAWMSYSSSDRYSPKSIQAILFSHPDDFTPVCTTECAEVSRHEAEFAKRNVKVIGLSANDVESHHKWIKDINEWGKTDLQFPIVCSLG
jgi:glutaredoxin/glutathione-dependent peroxiredoxin